MGPSAGLERCGKSRPPLGFDLRTIKPVASRYIYGLMMIYYSLLQRIFYGSVESCIEFIYAIIET